MITDMLFVFLFDETRFLFIMNFVMVKSILIPLTTVGGQSPSQTTHPATQLSDVKAACKNLKMCNNLIVICN